MPGYLGSEKQFIRRYQKPLLASSRDRDLEHGMYREFSQEKKTQHIALFIQDN